MAKLNLAQIRYIDNELLKLNFKFVDIRYEMLDHIASVMEEREGRFKDNLREYFILNKISLIKQYRKTKWTAIIRAISYYFKTMFSPVVFLLAATLFFAFYFGSIIYIDNAEIIFFGQCAWLVMLPAFYWLARDNKKLSVLKPMVAIQSILYIFQQWITIWTYSIEDRQLRILPLRISSCIVPALVLVLLISLYRYRKQYACKYI